MPLTSDFVSITCHAAFLLILFWSLCLSVDSLQIRQPGAQILKFQGFSRTFGYYLYIQGGKGSGHQALDTRSPSVVPLKSYGYDGPNGLCGRSVASKLNAHRFNTFFHPDTEIGKKVICFGETLRTRKLSRGKFFGAGTHWILTHSGFRKCIWFGWLTLCCFEVIAAQSETWRSKWVV